MSQAKTAASGEIVKAHNEMDRTVSAVKFDDDEYFDGDQEDKEYRELISNKSGKLRLVRHF